MSFRSTVLALLTVLVCHPAWADPGAVGVSPNLLIIVADDLGYSDLGCYGGEIETPHLDRLAAGGVRLTQFHTTARCCPSRASLMTGQYPHRVGLGHMTQDIGQPGYRGRVQPGFPTIAEVLSAAGYRAFLSGKWHLGTEDPTQHGFERFYGTLVSAKTFWQRDHFLEIPAEGSGQRSADHPANTSADASVGGEPFYGTDALTDQALRFLRLARQTPERPWLLCLTYNAPHFPLQARPGDIAKYADVYSVGWDRLRQRRLSTMKEIGVVPEHTALSPPSRYWNHGETERGTNPPWDSLSAPRRADLARRMAIYAAMVDRMDQGIGRVVSDLERHAELSRTLILFLSDNGACAEWDPFGFDIKSSNQNLLHRGSQLDAMGGPGTFHSVGSAWASVSNTPFRLYKHFCHQGGVLSPCIIHWPDRLAEHAGTFHRQPAHLIDVLPTAIDAAGVDDPAVTPSRDHAAWPGVSLLKQIESEPPAEQRALFLEHEGNRGVRHGRWKLVSLKDSAWELYDLKRDSTEQHDVADERPDVVRRLASSWERWAERNHVTPLPEDYQVDYLKPRTR